MPPSKDDSPLRRRQSPAEEKSIDTFRPAAQCASGASSRSVSPECRARIFTILASLSLSLFVYLHLRTPAPLPDVYALCSPDGPNIYTVDDANPRVECLVVRDARFVDAGSFAEIKRRWLNATLTSQRPDAAQDGHTSTLEFRYIKSGQIIVPGMSDSHAHILEYGGTKIMPIEGTHDASETVQRVREFILSDPVLRDDKSQFVEGWGWDHTRWVPEEWPTYTQLEADPVVAGRLIVLQSKDGHALWVSQKALEATKPLPDRVEGGVIVRDSSGKPTGVFVDNAQDLVIRPTPSHQTLTKRFAATVREAHARGLTAIHDAGFNPVSLDFFRKEAEDHRLPIRIYGMTYFDETAEYWGDRVTKIINAGNDRLSVRSVKIFADGALRSGGAALYKPYHDNPETCGSMRIAPEMLNSLIPKFMRDGWQVNVHAIGDRANGVVLDAFQAALKEANVTALRPRLEHAQILAEADMARFGDLGVIASIQPKHATSDMWFGEERLGPERVKGLYAFRRILDHGARITLGSDAPVEEINPMEAFYAAITRLSPDGKSPHGPDGWFPEQRMTREETLKGMTVDPAYASFTEDTLGTITPGKRADYVILSQNIMSVPAERILETRVIATVMDGRPVYGQL